MIAILSFVFDHVLRLNIPNYAAYLFVGLLPWIWFQSAILAGTQSVVGGRDLVRQPGFPTPLLPVVSIATTLINYVLALPIMLIWIGISFGHIPASVAALPLIVAVQFIVTLGPCYLLSAVNVRFRDMGHIVEIALLPLFYATPIFYLKPAKAFLTPGRPPQPGRFHLVYDLNPLSRLMDAYHAALYDGRWPQLLPLGILCLVGIVLIVVGYWVFDRLSYRFPEEL